MSQESNPKEQGLGLKIIYQIPDQVMVGCFVVYILVVMVEPLFKTRDGIFPQSIVRRRGDAPAIGFNRRGQGR